MTRDTTAPTGTATDPGRRAPAVRVGIAAVWTALVLALLGSLTSFVTVLTGRVLFASGGAEQRLPLTSLPQVVQAELQEGYTGFLTDVPLWLRLFCASPLVVEAVMIAAAGLLVARILRSIGSGDPFGPQVISALRRVAVVLLAGGFLQGILDLAAGRVLWNVSTDFTTVNIFDRYAVLNYAGPQWPWLLILLGVIAAALAVAFRQGARLQEETVGIV